MTKKNQNVFNWTYAKVFPTVIWPRHQTSFYSYHGVKACLNYQANKRYNGRLAI